MKKYFHKILVEITSVVLSKPVATSPLSQVPKFQKFSRVRQTTLAVRRSLAVILLRKIQQSNFVQLDRGQTPNGLRTKVTYTNYCDELAAASLYVWAYEVH